MADARHEVVRVGRVDDHLRGDAAARAERPRRQRGAQRVRAGGQGGRRYGYPSHRRAWCWLSYELQGPCGFLYRAESYASASCVLRSTQLNAQLPVSAYRVVVACAEQLRSKAKVKDKQAGRDRAQRVFSAGGRSLAAIETR